MGRDKSFQSLRMCTNLLDSRSSTGQEKEVTGIKMTLETSTQTAARLFCVIATLTHEAGCACTVGIFRLAEAEAQAKRGKTRMHTNAPVPNNTIACCCSAL